MGTYYKRLQDHPLEQIVHTDTKKAIMQAASDLPALWRSMKKLVQKSKVFTYWTPVDYIAKDGSIVHSDSLSLIDFSKASPTSSVIIPSFRIDPSSLELLASR